MFLQTKQNTTTPTALPAAAAEELEDITSPCNCSIEGVVLAV
jgi:hypothetical protein